MKKLDDASALPAKYPGWMLERQNARDPRGTSGGATAATVRAVAERLK